MKKEILSDRGGKMNSSEFPLVSFSHFFARHMRTYTCQPANENRGRIKYMIRLESKEQRERG